MSQKFRFQVTAYDKDSSASYGESFEIDWTEDTDVLDIRMDSGIQDFEERIPFRRYYLETDTDL